MDLLTLMAAQRKFAAAGQAKDVVFREQQLRKLKQLLKANENLLADAIYADFKKSKFETYLTELALVYKEIDEALGKISKWSRPQKVKTALALQPAKSFIVPEPFGHVLIIGAWNYPYNLTLAPLVAAMAAGNTCLVKPSELPARTSQALAQILNQNFEPGYLHVIEGGVEITQQLLAQRFDKIFFTGSTQVGKIVAKAAAEHLTPITLELGGKSPCLIFKDADLKITAQRIAWGKFLNAGQTCIAPDYLLVEESIYQPLMEELKIQTTKITGANPKQSESFVRIINERHAQRLQKLIDPTKVFMGGEVSVAENYVAPTLLKDVSFQDEIMQEEIFGPLLPIIPFRDLTKTLDEIKARPRPLSLYIFGRDTEVQKRILREVSFGGGCINDVVMHIGNTHMPFGGVGASGMGSYHGEFGFKTFSHYKSVLQKSFAFEPPLKYAPYSPWKIRILRWLFG